jgi:hypothetical protein
MTEHKRRLSCVALAMIAATLIASAPLTALADGTEKCKKYTVISKAEQDFVNRVNLTLLAALRAAPEGYTRGWALSNPIHLEPEWKYCIDYGGLKGTLPYKLEAQAHYNSREHKKQFKIRLTANVAPFQVKPNRVYQNVSYMAIGNPAAIEPGGTRLVNVGVSFDADGLMRDEAASPEFAAVMKSVVDTARLESAINGKFASMDELNAAVAQNGASDSHDGTGTSRGKKSAPSSSDVQSTGVNSAASATTANGTTAIPPAADTAEKTGDAAKAKEVTSAVKSLRGLLGK